MVWMMRRGGGTSHTELLQPCGQRGLGVAAGGRVSCGLALESVARHGLPRVSCGSRTSFLATPAAPWPHHLRRQRPAGGLPSSSRPLLPVNPQESRLRNHSPVATKPATCGAARRLSRGRHGLEPDAGARPVASIIATPPCAADELVEPQLVSGQLPGERGRPAELLPAGRIASCASWAFFTRLLYPAATRGRARAVERRCLRPCRRTAVSDSVVESVRM